MSLQVRFRGQGLGNPCPGDPYREDPCRCHGWLRGGAEQARGFRPGDARARLSQRFVSWYRVGGFLRGLLVVIPVLWKLTADQLGQRLRSARNCVLSRFWAGPWVETSFSEASPKDPCTFLVYTWALMGFLYSSFRAQVYSI